VKTSKLVVLIKNTSICNTYVANRRVSLKWMFNDVLSRSASSGPHESYNTNIEW